MKTLLITSDFPPFFSGGISQYYYNLCKNLSDNVCVLAPKHDEVDFFDAKQNFHIHRYNVPISSIPTSRILQAILFAIFSMKIIKKERIDIILCGHWYLGLAGLVIKALYNLPYCVFLHGGELQQRSKIIKRMGILILNRSDAIIVNSDFTKEQYSELEMKNHNVIKINPGVDITGFNYSTKKQRILKRYGMEGKKILLTVGRLVERKGHDVVIKALPSVLEKVPNLIYLIVGAGHMEKELKELVAAHNMEGKVVFAGYVSDEELPEYYNVCDVFVMPSREMNLREGIEGFGIVYLEANACAKPVIGGRSGGVNEAILDGVTGLLVDPLNVQDIAQAIIRISTDEEYARKMGTQGRKRVEEEFDWRLQTQKFKAFLEKLTL